MFAWVSLGRQEPNKNSDVLSVNHGRPPTDRAGSPVVFLARKKSRRSHPPVPRAPRRAIHRWSWSPRSIPRRTIKSTTRHVARCRLVAEHVDARSDMVRPTKVYTSVSRLLRPAWDEARRAGARVGANDTNFEHSRNPGDAGSFFFADSPLPFCVSPWLRRSPRPFVQLVRAGGGSRPVRRPD